MVGSNSNQSAPGPLCNNRAGDQVEELTERVGQINVDMDTDYEVNSRVKVMDNRRTSDEENHRPCSEMRSSGSIKLGENLLPMFTEKESRSSHSVDVARNIRKKTSMRENILIVTNLDPALFSDRILKEKFEILFTRYDPNVEFRYLKSFRRVRLDFSCDSAAESARLNLNNYKLGNKSFKCYTVQMIQPRIKSNNPMGLGQDDDYISYEDELNSDKNATMYLSIPKPTKQFLISPPASPPVGWEPVTESTPCMDVELLSALANLVPGQAHEIHAGTEYQPGIFVEVCEEPQFGSPKMSVRRAIPKTANPLKNSPM